MLTDRALGVLVVVLALISGALVTLAVAVSSDEETVREAKGARVAPTAGAPAPTPAPPNPSGTATPPSVDPYRPDAGWVQRTAAATGIPPRAMAAYARAHLQLQAEQPECAVAWNTLAALGWVESAHGTLDGTVLGEDGLSTPAIFGPRLDGEHFAAIHDTDAGAMDGDATWDRAVGPLQFIPSTWATWAADGNNDDRADPHQIDDAALAAARYLCHTDGLDSTEAWRRAVFSFNHSDDYVGDIAAVATTYAERAG